MSCRYCKVETNYKKPDHVEIERLVMCIVQIRTWKTDGSVRLKTGWGQGFLVIVGNGASLAPADLVAVQKRVEHDDDIHKRRGNEVDKIAHHEANAGDGVVREPCDDEEGPDLSAMGQYTEHRSSCMAEM